MPETLLRSTKPLRAKHPVSQKQSVAVSRTVTESATGIGRTSFDDLKSRFQYTDDLIHLTLGELQKNDLLESDYVSPFAGTNGRKVIRKVGLASMIALPVISALVAPSAAVAVLVRCSFSAPTNSNGRTAVCPYLNNGDCCGVCIMNGGGVGIPICSSPTAGANHRHQLAARRFPEINFRNRT